MSDTPNYVIWKPEHDGHAPPNWREGMGWELSGNAPRKWSKEPNWEAHNRYSVPAEALTAPNEDAKDVEPQDPRKSVHEALAILRGYSADELAKHGITLEPPKDEFVELFWDAQKAYGEARFRGDGLKDAAAILRTRFEQMKEGV